jgi:hypothetical protein
MNLHVRGLLPLVAAAAMVSCALAPVAGTPAARGDLLFLSAGGAIRTYDSASGAPHFLAEAAQPVPDWSALVSTGAGGTLTVLDGATGVERVSQPLAEELVVRAVSGDGRRAALMPGRASGESPYEPLGRERTTILVADLGSFASPRRLELAGNVEPEAFSVAGDALFVLEWLPPAQPDRYRVRRLDVETGAITPVFTREKAVNNEEMRGKGRQQALAPDVLYTLYTTEPDHTHARDVLRQAGGPPKPMTHAFVHTLGLDGGWTFCVDMPLPFGLGPSSAHTIAISPNGPWLYVADLSTGTVAAVDARSLYVVKTVAIEPDPAAAEGAAASVVGPDGTLYLGGPSGVAMLDGHSLAVKSRISTKGATAGLALSPDGRRLYVGQPQAVLVLDAADGRSLGSVRAPAFDLVRHVGRVAVR